MRAIVLGILLAVLICAVTPFNNTYRQATPLGGGHFPLAPFFILVWLTLFIAVGRKVLRQRVLLTGTELLVTWILMVLVSGIAYTGLVRTFFINLTAPFHFATVENRWQEVLQPLLPSTLYPQDPRAIEMLYNGLPGGRQQGWWQVLQGIPWQSWLMPLMAWSGFILLCYFVMVCIINLLGKQALYNERMNFPLLRVPELMESALDQNQLGRFFSDRFFLIGLLLPVTLHLLNGLHFYFPAVPQIPTLILTGSYFGKTGLFSGFYKLKIYFYPAFIGFAFLTSKQISFSFWLFFILGGLLYGVLGMLGYNIPTASLGITFGPTLYRPEETQMIGAYGVFFLFLIWLARYHLKEVVLMALGVSKQRQVEPGWMSVRVSFWGFVIGGCLLTLWLWHFGLSLLTAFVVLGAFFMVMLVASRVICQGGIAYFTLTAAPIDGLLTFFGPRFFSQTGLLITAVAQKVLFVDLRESLMPSLLHARKVTNQTTNQRALFAGIALTLLAGVMVSFIAMLALCYKFGVRELGLDWATRTTLAVYENVNSLVEAPVRPGHWVLIFSAVGAVVMIALVVCYHRIYWWPIHPIGYLTTYSSAMRILWFSFFIGWLFNALCMRYGGVVLFKRMRLLFIGLIVGDFLMGGAWAVVGLFSDSSYQVLPN
jgi:hypothetical protein